MAENLTDLISFSTSIDLTGFTLIIPVVCVGNVPQLAADLLIQTHNLVQIATLWHPALIPSVGGDPYEEADSTKICSACELYVNRDIKLGVLQIRSGIELKYAVRMFKALKAAIVDLKFTRVVLLASTFAHELHNINSGHFRYITNEPIDKSMLQLDILPMEKDDCDKYVLHGAGVVLKLYEVLTDSIKATVIIKYVSEGDNRPDAYSMVALLYKHIDNLKGYDISKVCSPKSWLHVYGNPPPLGIF